MTFQSSPICHADGRFFFLYFVTLLVYIHVRLVMIQIVYLFYNSDSAGQSPREANGFSAFREVLRILWNSGVHHRAHKTQLLISILRQLNPVTPSPHISFKVHVNLFPSTPRSSLRPLPFKRLYQAHVYFSSFPCMLHAPHIPSTLS
jgi:hypothetical protein